MPVRQHKLVAAWAVEKVGRLKLNGWLLTRSPLSHLVELEAMLLGRARYQSEELERLRVDAAVNVFGGEHEAVRMPPKRGKEN